MAGGIDGDPILRGDSQVRVLPVPVVVKKVTGDVDGNVVALVRPGGDYPQCVIDAQKEGCLVYLTASGDYQIVKLAPNAFETAQVMLGISREE